MTADAATRNKAIVAALSKRLSDLSLNTEQVAGKTFEGQDISSLFSSILQLKGNHDCLSNKDEVMKWVGFADEFPSDGDACNSVLTSLNDVLADKSVLIGEGFKSSEADVVVFSALHSFVGSLSKEDMQKIPNVMRWMDYIQNVEDFHGILQKILVEMAAFKHPGTNGLKNGDNLDAKRNLDKASLTPKYLEKAPVEAKKDATKKAPSENKSSEVKLKAPAKETLTKNVEVSINALNIQVGIIKKAWKHPSADSLLVEEIDVGEGKPRQVVSGLAKYYNPDDLTNRRVALITNVKPGKLRDVGSSGLVLCASNEDQTVVEPLLLPESAKAGERISFPGYDGQPEDVLNPKKKQLEKITPDLYTDDKGVATYKGIPFMTSAGPCTSSIPKASIK